MGIFNQTPSPQKEEFYKQVLEEVESGQMRKGIYAKALADGLGDVGKAQSLYIKYRVQSLVDEEKQRTQSLIDEENAEIAEREEQEMLVEREQKRLNNLDNSTSTGNRILITMLIVVALLALFNRIFSWNFLN